MALLPLAAEPFRLPTERDMLPSERRRFVETHRTCVLGYERRDDGPAQSIVYYIPTDDGEFLIATMGARAKAKPSNGWARSASLSSTSNGRPATSLCTAMPSSTTTEPSSST